MEMPTPVRPSPTQITLTSAALGRGVVIVMWGWGSVNCSANLSGDWAYCELFDFPRQAGVGFQRFHDS
jgi:hypothetical protein